MIYVIAALVVFTIMCLSMVALYVGPFWLLERSEGNTTTVERTDGGQNEVWERVYQIEVESDATYRIHGSVSQSRVEDTNATVRVDDISQGQVALVGFSDDPEASFYTKLSPEQARQLAQSLSNAAEYAEDQQ